MARGRKLPFRLKPLIPRGLYIGLPVFVTLLVVGFFLAFVWNDTLKPHQLQMGAILMGCIGLVCVVALARAVTTWMQAGSTDIEISLNPVRPGGEIEIYGQQRHDRPGLKRFEVRVVGFRRRGRAEEERLTDVLIGSAVPEGSLGLRVQVEGRFRVPDDALETGEANSLKVWWVIETRVTLQGAADLVEGYEFRVQRAA